MLFKTFIRKQLRLKAHTVTEIEPSDEQMVVQIERLGARKLYGQRHDCLIFNFVATNTIEGRVLQRLLDKLQEIRDALDDDTVFNVVGVVLPSAHVERVLRDYYAGALGDADLEERLLRNVDEGHFRAICQTALEGLASKRLNLDMLIERRARAQERRVVPETIARFIRECARNAALALKPVGHLAHTFDAGRTPPTLKKYEREPGWKLPELAIRYPRLSMDRDTAEENNLEWVTPGHPLFEAPCAGTVLISARTPLSGVPASIPWRMKRRRASISTEHGSWMVSDRSFTNGCLPWSWRMTAPPASTRWMSSAT